MQAHCTKPFDTIVVDGVGDAYVCGLQFNYTRIGNIRERETGALWSSSALLRFREKMLERDLPDRCKCCLHRTEGPQPPIESLPSRIFLRLSHRCNLHCIYCTLDRSKKYVSLAPILLKEMEPVLDCAALVNITGGEPLTEWEITLSILKRLRQHNSKCEIVIRTNGTLLSDRVISEFVGSKRISLIISLDAFSEKTFFLIKRGHGFSHVCAQITSLLDRKINVELQFLINRHNYTELSLFVNWCKSLSLPYFYRLLVSPPKYSLHYVSKEMKSHAIALFLSYGLTEFGIVESLRSGVIYST